MTSVPRFRSLLLAEEKLMEAEYFLRRLPRRRGYELGFELNAFLSAARSVTFLVQKEMSKVPGFAEWWDDRRAKMRTDEAMRFFLELRNYSQKEGRVAVLGQGSSARRWSHWFASGSIIVPHCLRDIEIVDACRQHLARLATLTLAVADAFPAWSCPHRALTAEGIRTLSIDLDDLDLALGYERGFSRIHGFEIEDRLRMMRTHFDGVDFEEIARLSKLRRRHRRKSDDRDSFFRHFNASIRSRMHPPG